MELNVNFALNNLSFGDCSYNILLELYKRGIYVNLFPIGNNFDISCFDKTPEDFKSYLQLCLSKAYKKYKREYPCLKLWHIQNSEQSISNDTYLFTFRELDQISELEVNILNNQKKIFVCCEETKDIFENHGVIKSITYIPLGFDSLHFKKNDKKYFDDGRITFFLGGKAEVRKAHERIIKLWIKKFGGNKKYFLELAITNPFFNPEQMNQFYARCFDNQKPPFNINIHGYLPTRSHLNDMYNAIDIVIDGSYYETWSLPSFTCVALGKHAVVHYVGGVKGWANEQNSCLFYPNQKEIAMDGFFFQNRGDFSFGNWYKWEDDEFIRAMENTVKRYEDNPININGLELQKQFTWEKSIDLILQNIEK